MLPSNEYGVLDEQVEALAGVAVGDDEGLGGHGIGPNDRS